MTRGAVRSMSVNVMAARLLQVSPQCCQKAKVYQHVASDLGPFSPTSRPCLALGLLWTGLNQSLRHALEEVVHRIAACSSVQNAPSSALAICLPSCLLFTDVRRCSCSSVSPDKDLAGTSFQASIGRFVSTSRLCLDPPAFGSLDLMSGTDISHLARLEEDIRTSRAALQDATPNRYD
jgi:hypothetical protein